MQVCDYIDSVRVVSRDKEIKQIWLEKQELAADTNVFIVRNR